MTDSEWNQDHVRCIGVPHAGSDIVEVDEQAQPIMDDHARLTV